MATKDDWIIVEAGCKGLPYWIRWVKPGVQDWTDDATEAHGYPTEAAAWRMIESAPTVFVGCSPQLRASVLRG